MVKGIDFEKVPQNGLYIQRSDQWLIEHHRFTNDDDLEGLRNILREEKFSIKSSGLTHRVMNLWTKSGIFPDRRHEENEWRKFNFVDLIWARVLGILRGYGLSIEKLKLAYKTVTYAYGQKDFFVNYFEFGVVGCLTRKQIWLLVFDDGWSEVVLDEDIQCSEQFHLTEATSYIKINLNSVVQKVYPNVPDPISDLNSVRLEPEELEIISLIRLGELSQLDIYLDGGVVSQLDTYLEEGPDMSPDEVIRKIQFGDLKVLRRDGKTQRIVRKERTKF
jgi:hypothetical protein